MEALWATILFSGFALEVIIRHKRRKENITERIEAIARKLAQQEFSETLVSAGVIELEI